MNKRQRKALKRAWMRDEWADARGLLPIAADELRALFEALDRELPSEGCEHSRRLTEEWLGTRRHDVDRVLAWLDEHSGICDCEILANVEQHVQVALSSAAR